MADAERSAKMMIEHEEICDTFERGWTPQNRGPAEIQGFLDKNLAKPFNAALVSDLIQIDLERSWMTWESDLSQSHANVGSEEILKRFADLPRLMDYRRLFGDVRLSEPHFSQLVQIEYELRNQCGDMIGPAYYQHFFGVNVSDDWGPVLRRVHCNGSEAWCRTLAGGIPLRGRNVLGRRRSTDGPDLDFESKPEGNRIVVAPRSESRVSRIQASVQMLSLNVACLSNDGSLNAIAISDGAPLKPGELRIIAFPFWLRLPNLMLNFR